MSAGGCSWFCDISAEKIVFSPGDVEGNVVGDHPGDMDVHDEDDGDGPGDVGDHGDGTGDVDDDGDGPDGVMFEAVS